MAIEKSRLDRRQFRAASTLSLAFTAKTSAKTDAPRKKVAFIGTEVRTHSHAQHFLDRMTLGYSWAGRWEMRFNVEKCHAYSILARTTRTSATP